MTLENPNKKLETIETTPEHPFYLEKNIDNSSRPKPIGHEDLSSFWVGAGHLKVGDTVKSSSGFGLVRKVLTLEKPEVMYNLTVDEAHTYFVGDGKWLVHNTFPCDIADNLIAGGTQVQGGSFPKTAAPNSTLYKRDPITGKVTNYQVYSADGMPLKRVDVTGKDHFIVPTPHVLRFDRNVSPTGQIFAFPRNDRMPLPARPDEIPTK